jgi:hypothetical protein
MRRAIAVLAFTGILASAAASYTGLPDGTAVSGTRAGATFLIPANDGYGIAECMASKGECGQLVAYAWCEAQGFTRANAFGLAEAEDVTGAIRKVSTAAQNQPYSITCEK